MINDKDGTLAHIKVSEPPQEVKPLLEQMFSTWAFLTILLSMWMPGHICILNEV